MFSIRQAAAKAGISEGLLILWIAAGKIKPSVNMTTANAKLDGVVARALATVAPDGEAFSWNRFMLTAEDVERLTSMVEQTAEKTARAEAAHVPGTAYNVKELASLWCFSEDKIRELFESEPDVIKVSSPARRGKRAYSSIRIPEKVAARVQRRLT